MPAAPNRRRRKPHVANGAPGEWSPWGIPPKAMKELRAIKYASGSRFHNRVFEITGWGRWSLPKRLDFLRTVTTEWARDPAIAEAAVKIIRQDGVQPRDHEAAWASLLGWVQRNIHYQNEPNERIQSPQYSLDAGFGDCDDMAILLAALGASLRMPWRFTVSGREKGGNRTKRRWVHGRGPIPKNVSWSHIYLNVGWPPFQPSKWVFAEPTLSVPLGWDVIGASKQRGRGGAGRGRHYLPEMAGTDSDLAGLLLLGHVPVNMGATVSETETTTVSVDPNVSRPSNLCRHASSTPWRDPKRFVTRLPWGQIVAATLPTVLSFYLISQLGKMTVKPKIKNNPRRRRRRR